MTETLKTLLVSSYLAYKQHLLPASRLADVAQVTRDIVALHATDPTGPYLSLWARVPEARSGIVATLIVPPQFPSLPPLVGEAVYRVVHESLSWRLTTMICTLAWPPCASWRPRRRAISSSGTTTTRG